MSQIGIKLTNCAPQISAQGTEMVDIPGKISRAVKKSIKNAAPTQTSRNKQVFVILVLRVQVVNAFEVYLNDSID